MLNDGNTSDLYYGGNKITIFGQDGTVSHQQMKHNVLAHCVLHCTFCTALDNVLYSTHRTAWHLVAGSRRSVTPPSGHVSRGGDLEGAEVGAGSRCNPLFWHVTQKVMLLAFLANMLVSTLPTYSPAIPGALFGESPVRIGGLHFYRAPQAERQTKTCLHIFEVFPCTYKILSLYLFVGIWNLYFLYPKQLFESIFMCIFF